MRRFDALDTGSFRAFYYAAEALNFTQAGKLAGLTQSGISQHVARLESQLGVSLFRRTTKQVALTPAGQRLRAYVERHLDDMERLREELGSEARGLEGPVSYSMPASCLLSPHFPLLLKARKRDFPRVDLNVTLCPSPEVVDRLLSARCDFGFVTRHSGEPDLHFEPFCQEEYILVAAPAENQSPLEECRWLEHPGVEVLWDLFHKAKFPRAKGRPWSSLTVVGGMNSLEGVLRMCAAGHGVTVVPRHCAQSLLDSGALVEWSVGAKGSVLNWIYIVTPTRLHLPLRVKAVINAFREMKKG